ncbi:MAG: glycosyltransferase family 39 protein [Actinobacteria bacterium]|nr:glycosyltransferase family 39 protein [Actinomycetota bacterium]
MHKLFCNISLVRLVNSKWFPLFIIATIPALLVVIWFKSGEILGTGESGLPFYDFNIQLNINKDAWAYYTLGHPLNIGAAATPTYWFFTQLQNLGVPTFILQAFFIWIIFLIAGLAIYKLVRELFASIGWIHALLAVLFYWFNPFSLVNVWNRFLNNFFVFYALLPISVYLFLKGLRRRNYIFALLIGFVSALLAYALTSVAFVFMFWGVLFYLGVFYFITHRGERLFIFKFFLLTLFFWFLTNFWWISQVLSYLQLGSFNEVIKTSFKQDTNYNTFSLLSERLGFLTYIFRLKHTSFFTDIFQQAWVRIYSFHLIVFFEFLISGIFLLPLIVKKRSGYVIMMAGLLFISIFLAKGNNPPLGEIFDKTFSSFSFLQIFRNPLEKIGFILSFSAAVLFAAGCFEIERIIGLSRKIITRIVISLFLLVIWGFPFWTGYVFTNTESPINKLEVGYRVKVPVVYKEVLKWLNSQRENFRLIGLPIGGEGITYTWEKGYSGVELTNQLLPKAAISFNTNIPFYDDISSALGRLISTREGLAKIMDILNSKYVLVRSDIDWKARGMRDPDIISRRIEKIASASSLEKIKEGDSLIFWMDTGWKDRSIYAA